MPISNLWLIRHGETADEYRGRCYGHSDVDLSPDGSRQLDDVARYLDGITLAGVYASPRVRCIQGAQIISQQCKCPMLTLPALCEIDFGEFEGRTYDEIAAQHPDFYAQWMASPTTVQFPGGECFVQMRERVLAAASALQAKHLGSDYAIVAHGGVNRIILAEALGTPAERLFHIGQRYGAINVIQYDGTSATVELMNASAGSFSGPRRNRSGYRYA